MKAIEIVFCDELPPKDELNAILTQYYDVIVRRMRDMGFAIDPSAPQSALAEFWANVADYLPPNGCLFVARGEAGQIVGCGMMKRLDGDTGELKRDFVTEAARGTGTGRRLVEARIAAGRQMGLKRLIADTLTPNVEMRSLYPKLGFVEVAGPLETTSYLDQPMLRPQLHYFVMEIGDRPGTRSRLGSGEGPALIPPLRLTRALVDRLPPRTDERAAVMLQDPPPEFYDRTAAQILARLGPDAVWVFAAGSLIWNPRMDVAERRAAHLTGWRRSFCLADRRFRGCPSTPGLMMSVDRGGACSGVALRMDTGDDPQAALVSLLRKEPPVPPEHVTAETDTGPVEAILFAADPGFPLYRPEPAMEDLADMLASAIGHVGTMAEYLLNTVNELERAGVHDLHLWRLQEMVAERLERLPEPAVAAVDRRPAGEAGDTNIPPSE